LADQEEPTTQELKVQQLQREVAERERAAQADDGETGSWERRADKSRYLREKLEEREQAEQNAAAEDAER
jgi:hypothetical protein